MYKKKKLVSGAVICSLIAVAMFVSGCMSTEERARLVDFADEVDSVSAAVAATEGSAAAYSATVTDPEAKANLDEIIAELEKARLSVETVADTARQMSSAESSGEQIGLVVAGILTALGLWVAPTPRSLLARKTNVNS